MVLNNAPSYFLIYKGLEGFRREKVASHASVIRHLFLTNPLVFNALSIEPTLTFKALSALAFESYLFCELSDVSVTNTGCLTLAALILAIPSAEIGCGLPFFVALLLALASGDIAIPLRAEDSLALCSSDFFLPLVHC